MPKDLTVAIVSYNCREVLLGCLDSLERSVQDVSYEVHLVDNASTDSTVEAVRARHPLVRLTASPENLGFSKANNLALREADTPFVLLLNPDTVVGDHCFDHSIGFLNAHPRAGMVSCRLVTGDGSLDLACRRSFPSAWDGFCRASGLSRWFPKSPLLARYNLTYLDEGHPARVDAVNGAYMMVTRKALDRVGLLDEDYFMYMEDMDWCWRFARAGFEVHYNPGCTVVHLKGQSSRAQSTRMIHAFYDSMELFCVKNTHPEHGLARTLTLAGIRAWKWLTLVRNALRANKRVRP
ncbi:glycosyltransferase family 2 protein [Fundidesulfovibrio terrae]|uniref:glycosyltransferase family 2 protein n=1 Tax=Fundidesulfovibrio terrae TaxID=2922866 RepID=UPI001FAF31FB